MKFQQVAPELAGYSRRGPGGEAEKIDAEVCAESICEACGNVGLSYRPFTLKGSYRAFAVCSCGEAVEF